MLRWPGDPPGGRHRESPFDNRALTSGIQHLPADLKMMVS
jgi:hypothetical protein